MPKNLEVKARIEKVEEAITIARSIGAAFQRELCQTDTYFQTPCGRLKLREIKNGHSELIFYDREETSSQRLSNYEVYPVEDSTTLKSILGHALGIRDIVRKRRLLFLYHSTRIHIDEVVDLGSFLEFETPVVNSLSVAEKVMNFLIASFNITGDAQLLHSYIDLLHEWNKS